MNKKRLLYHPKHLLLLVFLFPLFVWGQCVIHAEFKIRETASNKELPQVTVVIEEANVSSKTDSAGIVSFTNLCASQYSVSLVSPSFDTTMVQITLLSDTSITLFLQKKTSFLQPLEIRSTAALVQNPSINQTVFLAEIDQNQGVSLAEILAKTSAVRILKTGNSINKPIVNGLHSSRLLIINNEIRQEGQQWGLEHAPELDLYTSNSVTLINGASVLQYGSDALGGVILVQPKPLFEISKTLSVRANTTFMTNGRGNSTALLLEGKSKKLEGLYWRTQGSVKRMGDLKTPTYYLKNTGSKEYNFSVATGYFKEKIAVELFYSQFNTEVAIFEGSHIGNLTDLTEAIQTDKNDVNTPFSYQQNKPKQLVEHELFKLKATAYIKANQSVSLVLGRQYNLRSEYDLHTPRIDSIAALGLPQLKYELVTYSGAVTYKYNHKIGYHFAGIQASYMTNVYEGRYFIPNYIDQTIGAFFIEKIQFKKADLETSLRYDTKSQTAYFWQNNQIVSPKKSFQNMAYASTLVIPLYKKWIGDVTVSSTWRAPSVNELYSNGLHHGTASFEKGNPNLEYERKYLIAMGLSYSRQETRFSLTPFYSQIHDFINLVPTLQPVLTIQGAFPAFEYQQKDVIFKGFTAIGNQELIRKKLIFAAKISVLRVVDKQSQEPVYGIPADNLSVNLKYILPTVTPKNNLTKIRQDVALEWNYTAKQNHVNPNLDYAAPPPAYSLFSLFYGNTIHTKTSEIKLYVGVENIFNVAYKDYMNRLRYFSNETGRNITLRIIYTF